MTDTQVEAAVAAIKPILDELYANGWEAKYLDRQRIVQAALAAAKGVGSGPPVISPQEDQVHYGMTKPTDAQPRMIPNPLWCDKCEGRGYLVFDAEWEPYAVQCDHCKRARANHSKKK